MNEIAKLLELFICPDNEIRAMSEQKYQSFEQQDPEKAIELLFEIINSNPSLISTQQALIRLRILLQSSLSPDSVISLEVASQIKSSLLDFVNKSDNLILTKYSLSIVLDFYFKSFKNESMWEGFSQYLVDLYQSKPLISLYSLTLIYDIYPNEDLASQICSYMIFDQDPKLNVQSIISGLILIKHRFKFGNIEQFVSSLTHRFSTISDSDLVGPLETFHSAFLSFSNLFEPLITEIFKYFLEVIVDFNHSENIRVQCMHIFTDFALNSSEFRSIILSNPRDIALAVAISVSEPHQYDDIYHEAKKCLKYILNASMNDSSVFDQSLEEFGSSENIYVKSVFQYHILSDYSLDFAFENVFHEDALIQHDCLKIIFKYYDNINFCKFYDDIANSSEKEDDDENSQKNTSLKKLIEDKVADIFVEFFKDPNYEIYKFFKKWCECSGSDSLVKCVDPFFELLQKKCDNELQLLIASLLCSRYLDNKAMQEIASNLLEISKESISEQKENQVFLEIINNLLPNLDSESRSKLLDEILPNIFQSIDLTASLYFMQIIETLKQDFIPYLPNYLDILFKYAFNLNTKESTESKLNADEIDQDSIFFNDSDLKNLRFMLNSLDMILFNYIDICKNEESIYSNIIKIISIYLTFEYDDEVQSEAILLCEDFIHEYSEDLEFDVILSLIQPIIKGVETTNNIMNLSLFSSFTFYLTDICSQEYVEYISILLPLIFAKLSKLIQKANNKDQYYDGFESYSINDMFNDLENSFYLMFDIDLKSAIRIFHQIIEIVPYFKSDDLDDEIKSFVSAVWVGFVSFTPTNEWPDPVPDLLNDLFEFFYITFNNKVKESIIISIGTLVYNFLPKLEKSILYEFEKIISNDDESIDVRKNACIQYVLLVLKCDQIATKSKIDDISRMISFFAHENSNFFCVNIAEFAKLIVNQCLDNQFIKKLFINRKLLYHDDFINVVDECKKFNQDQ